MFLVIYHKTFLFNALINRLHSKTFDMYENLINNGKKVNKFIPYFMITITTTKSYSLYECFTRSKTIKKSNQKASQKNDP